MDATPLFTYPGLHIMPRKDLPASSDRYDWLTGIVDPVLCH
jgi:hypothetical protein